MMDSHPGEDHTASRIKKLFQSCQEKHRQTYPMSKLDFEADNLTKRLSKSRVPLGQSRHSDLYKGELDDGTKIAAKVLRLPLYEAEEEEAYKALISRFFYELSCWSGAKHVNISQFLGFTYSTDSIGFMTPFHPYGNVSQYLKSGATESIKHNVMLDVAEGIQYLHTHVPPYVHGDLKGTNVLINGDGVACIGDFGVSGLVTDLSRFDSFTTDIGLKGVVPWAAPEVLNGEAPSMASDVYAFGGIMLEIYCPGKTPYHNMTEVQIVVKKLGGALPDRSLYTELQSEDELWDLMVCCWNGYPSVRPNIQAITKRLYGQFGLGLRVLQFVANRPPALEPVPRPNLAVQSNQPAQPTINPYISEKGVWRHDAILKLIGAEEGYLKDLEVTSTAMEQMLSTHSNKLLWTDDAKNIVSGILILLSPFRKSSKSFLCALYDRYREQRDIIYQIGDICLQHATEFTTAFKCYVGQQRTAEHRFDAEMKEKQGFCSLLEHYTTNNSGCKDISSLLNLPSNQLLEYEGLMGAIKANTGPSGSELEDIRKALMLLSGGLKIMKIEKWQNAMIPKPTEYPEWQSAVGENLYSEDDLSNEEIRIQQLIYSMILKQMTYVKDLDIVWAAYFQPLRDVASPFDHPGQSSLPLEELVPFEDLCQHHTSLLNHLHHIQRTEYPRIPLHSILDAILHFATDWVEVYKRFLLSYPLVIFWVTHKRVSESGIQPSNYDPFQTSEQVYSSQLPDSIELVMALPFWYRDSFLPDLEIAISWGIDVHDRMEQVRQLIQSLFLDLEPRISESRRRVAMLGLVAYLDGIPENLKPFDEGRELVHSGLLYYGPSNQAQKCYCALFDNYLLIIAADPTNEANRYRCIKAFSLMNITITGFTKASKTIGKPSPREVVYPFAVVNKVKAGEKGCELFATTGEEREVWKHHFLKAGIPEQHSSPAMSFFKYFVFR